MNYLLALGIFCMFPFLYFVLKQANDPMRMDNLPEEMQIKGQILGLASLALMLIGFLLIVLWYNIIN